MAPLRFGILGCAEFALRRMIPAIAATPGCEVAGVASRRLDAATEVAQVFGCRPFHGYQRLLDDDGIDAVYVPLPSALTPRWAEATLRAGKHVLAEKPLASDAATAAWLLALAERGGLALTENILFLHHEQHGAVRSLIAHGAIGDVRWFDAGFAIPRVPPADIRLRADLGGGALSDTGVYPLRVASYFLGAGLTVAGATCVPDPSGVDIAGAVLLRAPNGVGVTAMFGLDHAYRNQYTVWGSAGRIVVDRAFTPAADQSPDVLLHRGSDVERIDLPARDQAVAAVAAFADAARAGRSPDPDDVWEQARLRDAVRAEAGLIANANRGKEPRR
jgi:predicted dehydrogenase